MSNVNDPTPIDLHDLLRQRYSGSEWALCFEVPDGTASNKRRTIDALAISCWRSGLFHLHGHEIKHSRADWLKELNQPTKQMTWFPYLHRFWIVALKGVVKVDELPAEWGLMEHRGSGLKVSKAASLFSPRSIPHDVLAAIMRRLLKTPASQKELELEYSRGYADGKIRDDRAREYEAKINAAQRKAADAVERLRVFEAMSGVSINCWNAGNVGREFKAFQELQHGAWDRCLQAARQFVATAENLHGPDNQTERYDDERKNSSKAGSR